MVCESLRTPRVGIAGLHAQPVAHDGQKIESRRHRRVNPRLARGPQERQHRVRLHVRAHRTDGLRPVQQHTDRIVQVSLHRLRELVHLHASAHDGDDEVALGRALLHEMGQEAEERRLRIVGIRQRLGIHREGQQAIHQDGFAELLLGRKVAIERAHSHAGLLGDQVDRDLDPFDGENVLGGFENPGPVALGIGPLRARAGAGRLVISLQSPFHKSLLPR